MKAIRRCPAKCESGFMPVRMQDGTSERIPCSECGRDDGRQVFDSDATCIRRVGWNQDDGLPESCCGADNLGSLGSLHVHFLQDVRRSVLNHELGSELEVTEPVCVDCLRDYITDLVLVGMTNAPLDADEPGADEWKYLRKLSGRIRLSRAVVVRAIQEEFVEVPAPAAEEGS